MNDNEKNAYSGRKRADLTGWHHILISTRRTADRKKPIDFSCRCGNKWRPGFVQDHRIPIDCNPKRIGPYEKCEVIYKLVRIRKKKK